jgi:ADP-ribosyl-[dinitrogen reductase] hydrolase
MIDSKRTREAVLDRGIGCLVGLAVGDALGATLEFKTRDQHPPVTDLVGGGTFNLKPGEWTDDTSMALCLADSIIECNGLNTRDLMERFIRWRDDGENSPTGYCIDVGGTITDAINRYLRTGNPESGPVHEYAAGNGSIMRLAPVALRWHNDPEAARRHARAQSRTTHGAPAAVEASALLADILVDAIKTGDKAYALRSRDVDVRGLSRIAHGDWRAKERAGIKSSGYVVDTLEAALWSVHSSDSFADAVILAANLGGDADTVGAVTGQIAGALWGSTGIPRVWLDKLAWRDRIEDRARRLMAAAS